MATDAKTALIASKGTTTAKAWTALSNAQRTEVAKVNANLANALSSLAVAAK